ncbi:hypothetical protein NAI77_10115, partial [Francisella tularensis subsp. holarctica]|nr:hypothetical protein [Francisella tularensis subsp. holarctica]
NYFCEQKIVIIRLLAYNYKPYTLSDIPKVLVAVDDKKIALFIKSNVDENGFDSTVAFAGQVALVLSDSNNSDA